MDRSEDAVKRAAALSREGGRAGMYLLLWIFFIYAFLGWCTEVGYAALITGKFVNRGFLNGPVCPIYGFGVVIVLACLTPLKDNLPILFLGSVLLTSALEWLTGFVLEKIFHERWWDYSDEPFNLGGYICLRFSIAWGFACLFVVKMLHPTVLFVIRIIPHTLGLVLLGLLSAVMAVDLAATVQAIAGINRRLQRIDELAVKIKAASNDFGEDLADKVLDAAERGAEMREELDVWMDEAAQRREDAQAHLREKKAALRAQLVEWKESLQEQMSWEGFGQRRLLRAFPKMRSTDYKAALERLRRSLERRR